MSFLSLERTITLDRHRSIMKDVYARINNFHKRPLHPGQIEIAKKLFIEGKRILQIQCGRSFGKTEAILYIAWVYALLNDGALIYIICPERTHAKKIYWTPRRLQDYGPQDYVLEHRDSDLITVLKNGSKIVLDGCENAKSLRGIKPNLVIYEEFQEHSKEFDEEVMQPNLIAKSSKLVVVGTPPKTDCYYVEFRQKLLNAIASGDNTRWYTEALSEMNPSLDKDELMKKKAELIRQGDEKIWLREYEGKLIFGGEGAVFPYWDRRVHIYNQSSLLLFVEKDKSKLKWFTICDPGTSSCFAVMFACYNPFTSQLFILDEIYEKDRKKTDTNSIWPRITSIEQKLYPGGKFRRIYDEAALWFQREVQANYRENLSPTDKYHRNDENDVGLIKSLMAEPDHFLVSNTCKNFVWELENYVTDERGRYPDDNDHLIDCLKYLVHAASIKFINDIYKASIDRGEVDFFPKNRPAVVTLNLKHDRWDGMAVDEIGDFDDSGIWDA